MTDAVVRPKGLPSYRFVLLYGAFAMTLAVGLICLMGGAAILALDAVGWLPDFRIVPLGETSRLGAAFDLWLHLCVRLGPNIWIFGVCGQLAIRWFEGRSHAPADAGRPAVEG